MHVLSIVVPFAVGLLNVGEVWKIEISTPTVVCRAAQDAPTGNMGFYHYVRLFRDSAGRIVCRWAMRPDSRDHWKQDKSYAYSLSRDGGKTWGPMRYYPVSLGTMIERGEGGLLGIGRNLFSTDGTEMKTGMLEMYVFDLPPGEDRTSPLRKVKVRFPDHYDFKRVRTRRIFLDHPYYDFHCDSQGIRDSSGRLLQLFHVVDTADHCHVILIASRDEGKNWSMVGTVASFDRPTPPPLGQTGYTEAGLAELKDGRLFCTMRTHYQPRRLMAQCWSNDGGKTWTTPVVCPGIPEFDPEKDLVRHNREGKPVLKWNNANVSPWLARLSNGVLAMSFGRPGVKVAFSFDGTGERWDRVIDIVKPDDPRSYFYTTDVTTAMTGMVPIAEDTLLLAYDIYGYAPDAKTKPRNTIFAQTIRVSPAPKGPVEIKAGQAQLFVDDYLIDRQKDLRRTLHQPRKDNGGNRPVIDLGKEPGADAGSLYGSGTILFDPNLKQYVMLTSAFFRSLPKEDPDRVRLFRLTSDDGMTWKKGPDGRLQRAQIPLTDPVTGRRVARNFDASSFTDDERDREFPYKGWTYMVSLGGPEIEGIWYIRSRDGISWERVSRVIPASSRTIRQNGRELAGPGDVTQFYHDAAENRYLGLIKFLGTQKGPSDNLFRSRGYLFLDRLDRPVDMNRIDHVDLVPPAASIHGDQPADEYYAATGWRYESLWLGGLKIWHGTDDYSYSAPGCAFLKLAVSRDGLHWSKVPFANESGVSEVWIPNGAEGGNGGQNDGGYMTMFTNGPLRIGDELIYYYGSTSYGKLAGKKAVTGGGIFRARLRVDGFVSVGAGSLTTRILHYQGENLFVNSVGNIRVDLLDEGGKVLATSALSEDSLAHRVTFNGKSLHQAVPDGKVRLQFSVSDGHLYSFTVK